MSYEIPQQIQHKEKIIFGLTFSQLGWVSLFGAIVLIILTGEGNIWTKGALATIPGVLGILFAFFDIGKWIRRIFHFLKYREANLNSEEMQELIGIKKIEDDVVHAHKKVSVLKVTPLNFKIKTKEEQEMIILGFQKFLNSLDFPIQFVVTTSDVSLDSYLKSMKRRVNNAPLFNDFSQFIKKTIQENQMRNRQFYVIIPTKSILEIQTILCKERLESIGLKVERAHTDELLHNFRFFFNGLDVKREAVDTVLDNATFLIAPNSIKNHIDYLTVNSDKLCRVISATGYPRNVESGFLDKIISSTGDFDISIHIEPFSIETMMIILNKELQKQRADLYSEEQKKSINPSLEIKYKDTRRVLEELQKGTDKLFNVSLYINCKGKNLEELNLLTKKVESDLNSIMIVPSTPKLRQIQAYKSMFPIAKDELKTKRNITTQALSAFFPFTSPFLTVESNGVMLGLNKNKVPYIKDIFALSNANGIILATSGSGKSYFTKLLISRQLLNNTKVMVIDPQNEYTGLVKHCNGELITISRHSKTIINPLDLMGHDYVEKRLALMDIFTIMFGELSEVQKSILDKAINQTYARKGIHADSYKDKKPPTLSHLYKTLKSMEKKSSQYEKVTYTALLNRLYMYTHGVFSFLNRQSKINFEKEFVCFNIGDMPKQVKPVVMFLILDYVYMKMKESRERKLLVIDEAWSLLGRAEDASYIFEIVKTCRKFNMGLLLITQDVADLVNSKAGHAVLANTAYSFLLRQKPAVIDSVVRTFNLSDMEREHLLVATQGKGILILDNEHQELEVVASQKEHELITTNPNEVLRTEGKEDDRTDINVKLDLNTELFYGENLTLEDKNFLGNKGYKAGYFVPIGKKRQEECWIKVNEVESIDHTFLVQNIKSELERYTKDIEIAISEKPDILFKNKKGETIALEVETGKSFKKHKQRLIQKFHQVKLKYKKQAYIILTSAQDKYKYTQISDGIPVLLRTDIQQLFQGQFQKK